MTKYEELENTLLDQIEKLNDDDLFKDTEEAKLVLNKSKAIADLSNAVIGLKNAQIQEKRIKLDAVRIAMSAEGYGYSKFLGIEEDKPKTH